VYREQEETRRKWLDQQAAQVAEARTAAEAGVHAAREQIAAEAASAKITLEATAATLADEIATTVLGRRAA
jgi:hypothetical protein